MPTILKEEKKIDNIEEVKIDPKYYVDTHKQVVKWLRNEDDISRMGEDEENRLDDDGLDEEDSNYMSDDAANKRAL